MWVLLLSTGCNALVDSDKKQCRTNGDCANRGADFAGSVCVDEICQPNPTWACLGKVAWPAAAPGNVTVTLHLTDIISEQPVPGVRGRVCRKLDVDCSQPIVADLQSDANGRLVAQVPNGFDGYVDILPTDAIKGSYFFYPPVTHDRDVPYIPIVQVQSLGAFAQIAGTTLMPERGQVFLGARDCREAPAEGIRLSSADGDTYTAPFYLVKRIPSTRAAGTDLDGYGGVLNLRPGTATVSGTLPTGQLMGTVAVVARANWISYTTLVPTPN